MGHLQQASPSTALARPAPGSPPRVIRIDSSPEYCRELGVTTLAKAPLGWGFMTGQYKSADYFEDYDFRRQLPWFPGDNFKKNTQLVDEFPIKCLEKSMEALKIVLRKEEENELRALVDAADVQGDQGAAFGSYSGSPAL
ncbi:aldo/keto reductase [Colletotrichum orchidophilum]|uniref:Aldo/keto reductase n=1 Tax=Colletotrichum orchidophilum TaxID=1209926 RepID=A0A1G4B1B2_9PEZI|nr:aldo/keto reductase [Colletotrichum orchidophilum]OHE95171.1 aldo/keto reductase [Colletotrichum orchidophilum]